MDLFYSLQVYKFPFEEGGDKMEKCKKKKKKKGLLPKISLIWEEKDKQI